MTLTDAPPALAGADTAPRDGALTDDPFGGDHTSTPPPAEPPLPTESGSPWRDRFHAPTRSGWITIAIALLAAGLYTWGLGSAGVANDYYSAAVKAMSTSWKAFFYGSIDSGSFITVDKPPASLWVMALSARIFGFSTWSMLLPQAAAGVASVLIVHRIVREWMGNVAAHLATLAFALTPVAVVMFRYNNPDALLTLLGLGSAWAIWIALKTGHTRWLILSAALVGLAFETKMLQALVVLPAFIAVYLFFGPPKLGKRLWQLALAAVTVLVSAGWWIAIVALVPASSRPYIGSTTDNSIISLVLGYNGLNRIFGGDGSSAGGSGGPGGGGGGPSFGGAVSWLRMFNTEVGGQVAWLIPLALVGLGAGLWLTRRNPRDDLARAGWVLWGAWAVVSIVVFSRAEGIFHPYYTVQLAPAVAALAGAGAIALWQLGRRHPVTRWLLSATIVVTAGVAVTILRRTPDFASWLPMAIIIGAALSAAGLWIGSSLRHRTLTLVAATVAGLTLLAGPTAYSLTTVAHTQSGSLAAAGPSSASSGFPGGASGPGGSSTSSIEGDTALADWLEANQGDATWLVAAFSSHSSAPIILATGEPVMTIGGFNGQDPAPTLDEFIEYVQSGELRYVIVDGSGAMGGMGAMGAMGGGPGGGSSEITSWVTENGTAVDTGTGTTVHDLSAAVTTDASTVPADD